MSGKIQTSTNFLHGDLNNPDAFFNQICLYIEMKMEVRFQSSAGNNTHIKFILGLFGTSKANLKNIDCSRSGLPNPDQVQRHFLL